MHYNQFYHLHAIRVNPYNRVDFGRLAAKNMPIRSTHTLSDVSAQLTQRKRQLHARIAAFCIDWERSCVSPSADGEELSSCCCLDAPPVLCYWVIKGRFPALCRLSSARLVNEFAHIT